MSSINGITTFALVAALTTPLSGIGLAQGHDHGQSAQHQQDSQQAEERIGDPYPLQRDIVSGKSLADIDEPVVYLLHGRELRFADEESLKTFKAHQPDYLKMIDEKIIKEQTPLYPLETCLVSGEELGQMGEPFDMVINNRLVRLCCKGCVARFKKDSEKYLDTLNQAVIKKQKDDYPLNTCLVSGEQFGGMMGEPVDYVIGNKLVRFCCKMCIRKFEANPATFLAMLSTHDTQDQMNHDEGGHMHNHEGHSGG